MYPAGVILMAFNISNLFSTVENAMKILPLLNMFAGTIPVVVVNIMWLLPSPWSSIARGIHVAMSVINPVYSLPGMMVVSQSIEPCCNGLEEYLTSWVAVPLYLSPAAILLYAALLISHDYRSYYTVPG